MWGGIGMMAVAAGILGYDLYLEMRYRGAVAAAGLIFTGWSGIPGDVLRIEISYTFLASIAIGAIVGGLSGKLIAPAV